MEQTRNENFDYSISFTDDNISFSKNTSSVNNDRGLETPISASPFKGLSSTPVSSNSKKLKPPALRNLADQMDFEGSFMTGGQSQDTSALLAVAAESLRMEESVVATDILLAAAQALQIESSQILPKSKVQDPVTVLEALKQVAQEQEQEQQVVQEEDTHTRESTFKVLQQANNQIQEEDVDEGTAAFQKAAEEFREIQKAVELLATEANQEPAVDAASPEAPQISAPETMRAQKVVPKTTNVQEAVPETEETSPPAKVLPKYTYTQQIQQPRSHYHRPLQRVSTPQQSCPSHISNRVSKMSATSSISKAQKLLLEKSKNMGGKAKQQPKISREKVENLARPKQIHDGSLYRSPIADLALSTFVRGKNEQEKKQLMHGCIDDMKNCTFRPKIRKNPLAEQDLDNKDNAGDNATAFRLEAYKKGIEKDHQRTKEESDYKIRLDKRYCPQCGQPQSYDELISKKKDCQNCGVRFRKKTTWTRIEKDFAERMLTAQEKVASKIETLREEEMKEIGKPRLHGTKNSQVVTRTDEDFVVRMQDDLYRRELRKAQYEYESDALSKDCTFEPMLSKDFRMPVSEACFDERMEVDLHKRQIGKEVLRHKLSYFQSNNTQMSFLASKAAKADLNLTEHTLLRDSLMK